MWAFNNATAPRSPNFNPADKYQSQKPHWLRDLSFLSKSKIDFIDWQYRLRLQALLGIDELVEDVVEFLRSSGDLNNTYSKI
jgi:N-acetylglucosamine-6-sulfatase